MSNRTPIVKTKTKVVKRFVMKWTRRCWGCMYKRVYIAYEHLQVVDAYAGYRKKTNQ